MSPTFFNGVGKQSKGLTFQDPAYEYQIPKQDDILTTFVDTVTDKIISTFKPVIETAR
jgi:hypothetical protein